MVGVEAVQVVHAFRILAAPGTVLAVVVGVARGIVVVGSEVANSHILLERNNNEKENKDRVTDWWFSAQSTS